VVFYGAGSSAVGVAEMIARLIELDAKVSAETARKVRRPAPPPPAASPLGEPIRASLRWVACCWVLCCITKHCQPQGRKLTCMVAWSEHQKWTTAPARRVRAMLQPCKAQTRIFGSQAA